MMNKAVKNIMLRVIKKRMVDGESIKDILAGYPKLTVEEKSELKDAVSIT